MRPVLRPNLRIARLCLTGLLVCSAPVHAADWLTVASDRVRRVELDLASITPSDAGSKVAWGRIVLSDDQAKAYGYRTVRALNRYDCRAHAFIIVKRVYLSSDENVLREDKIDATQPISVKAGTVDDRFFNEVCRPASVADLKRTAKQAAERLATVEARDNEKTSDKEKEPDKPVLRRADIQLTRDEPAPVAAQPKSHATPETATNKTPASPPASNKQAAGKPETHPAPQEPAVSSPAAQAMASSSAMTSATIRPARPMLTLPAIPAASPSPAERDAQRIVAEQAAARAAARISAMSPHRESSPVVMRRAPAQQPQAALPAAASTSDAQILHWSYEGPGGPENWGKLDPEFSVCSNGKRQSPIDIRDGIKVDQEPIQFDYKPTYFRIVDNGHTVQISYGAGSHITVMGRTYDLVQFHFHHPAEERINGKGFAMVAHLVHRDPEGHLAVIAVLLEAGQANSLIQTLWNNLPLEQNEDYSPRVAIQATDILPASRDYISYIGSLTTPPCTEGVLWLVMKQPVQLSAEQIDVFSRFYPNNARPLQAASGRIIKESR